MVSRLILVLLTVLVAFPALAANSKKTHIQELIKEEEKAKRPVNLTPKEGYFIAPDLFVTAASLVRDRASKNWSDSVTLTLGNGDKILGEKFYALHPEAKKKLPLEHALVKLARPAEGKDIKLFTLVPINEGCGIDKPQKDAAVRWKATHVRKIYKWASKEGSPEALYRMGLMYNCDCCAEEGIRKNDQKAAQLFRAAGEKRNAKALVILQSMTEKGRGVPKNWSQADRMKEAEKLALQAADLGDPRGLVNMAICFEEGRGVQKDVKKTGKYYLRAAEMGHAGAQCSTGSIYQFGDFGFPKDEKRAYEWFLKSAKQGYTDAEVQVGLMIQDGKGVEKDGARGYTFIKKAALKGHNLALKVMQSFVAHGGQVPTFDFGCMYLHGKGVPQNVALGIKLIEKVEGYLCVLSIGGVFGVKMPKLAVGAIYELGSLYLEGKYFKDKKDTGVRLIRAASDHDYALAQKHLGYLYLNGTEVEKDEKKAAELLRKAVDQGNANAMGILGFMHKTGKGVEKDMDEALLLFALGATDGDKYCQEQLDKMK